MTSSDKIVFETCKIFFLTIKVEIYFQSLHVGVNH